MSTKWWKNAVVYQIYPRSFCDANGDGIGDLEGIISKLDYLKELGVDVIWISPIYCSPNKDNGYDIKNYYNIMDEFGTMEDFDRLLLEVHRRGLKLVMDLVVNHTSDEHPWFIQSKSSKDNPYRDFYIWKKGKGGKEPNNWGSWFHGSAWEPDQENDMYYLHIFSSGQPDLNWDNPALRKEIYKMMIWWLEKGVDGFRMDVISLISKDSRFPEGKVTGAYGVYGDLTPYCENGPFVHKYLKEMNRKVLSSYDIMTVGEAPNATVEEAVQYANKDGSELNMIFQFEHVMIDHGVYGKYTTNKFRLEDLIRVMSKWQEGLYGKGWNSLYLENHDQPRSVSRFGDDKTEEAWEKSAKMLATCLHMLQGTPYIYQGQEIGMTNPYFASIEDYPDIEAQNFYKILVLDQKVMTKEEFLQCVQNLGRDNARTPMQWNDSVNAGFSRTDPWIKVNPNYKKINVAAQMTDSNSIWNYYKKLISLRKKYKIITDGRYQLLDISSDKIWAYKRIEQDQELIVLANFTNNITSCSLSGIDEDILISNYECHKKGILQAYEVIVYHVGEFKRD